MNAILSNDQIRHIAPSVFAASPWHKMSDRYKFVPTSEVVGILRGQGFHPVKAMQSRSRIEGRGDFTRHLLRFRHVAHLTATVVGQETPELVLSNAHDGTSAYRLMAGIFRLVCGNGLTVQSADFGSISVKHSGGKDFNQRIIDATYTVVSEMPKTMDKIETWKGITLTAPQQLAFASAALELKGSRNIEPKHLLAPLRNEDRPAEDGSRDLWRTMNTTQEHLVKGGLSSTAPTGRRTRTRPIKAVDADLRTNRALWLLAEKMAELVK